jgi:hypothetical protein
MRSRLALALEAIGCILLLIVTLWIALAPPRELRDRDAASRGDVTQTVADEDVGWTPPTGGARRRAAPAAPSKPRPPSRNVRGRVALILPDGSRHERPTGGIFLAARISGEGEEIHHAVVEEGAFALDLPLGSALRAHTARLEERYASVEMAEATVVDELELDVVARASPSARLFALTATGAPLGEVALRPARGPRELALLPTAAELESDTPFRERSLPIALPGDLPAIDVWVDAEGFAFRRLRAVLDRRDDLLIRLEAPGTLLVGFTAQPSGTPPYLLEIATADGRARFETSLGEQVGAHSFERLAPGDYRIALRDAAGAALAAADIALRDGVIAQALLDPRAVARATVRGRVVLPPSLTPPPATLRVLHAAQGTAFRQAMRIPLATTSHDERGIEFEFERRVGEATRLELEGEAVAIELPPFAIEEAVDIVEFMVPELLPFEVLLRQHDGTPAAIGANERVRFVSRALGPEAGVLAQRRERGSFHARVPAGAIEIEVDAIDLRFTGGLARGVALTRDGLAAPLELVVERALATLHVAFEFDGRTLVPTDDFPLVIERAGIEVAARRLGARVEVPIFESGPLRISFPGPNGAPYLGLAAIDLAVDAAIDRELRIPLPSLP